MFCKNCGKEIADGSKFCDGCGAPMKTEQPVEQPPVQETPTNKDEHENKVIFMLSYLGILFFLPLVSCPNSNTGRFHANQGLILLLTGIVGQIILSILTTFMWRFWTLLSLLSTAFGLAMLALVIIGMMHANKGEHKELPIIGHFHILKGAY